MLLTFYVLIVTCLNCLSLRTRKKLLQEPKTSICRKKKKNASILHQGALRVPQALLFHGFGLRFSIYAQVYEVVVLNLSGTFRKHFRLFVCLFVLFVLFVCLQLYFLYVARTVIAFTVGVLCKSKADRVRKLTAHAQGFLQRKPAHGVTLAFWAHKRTCFCPAFKLRATWCPYFSSWSIFKFILCELCALLAKGSSNKRSKNLRSKMEKGEPYSFPVPAPSIIPLTFFVVHCTWISLKSSECNRQ